MSIVIAPARFILLCMAVSIFIMDTAAGSDNSAAASGNEQPAQENHRYLETGGASDLVYRVTIAYGRQVTVTSLHDTERVVKICSYNGDTISWDFDSHDVSIYGMRKNNTLILKGTSHGTAVDKRFTIDDSPWYQPGTYCFRNFVNSNDDTISFWMVRRDILKPEKMQAKKEGLQTIRIQNESIPAQKVRVRLSGVRSIFWHGDYWFRKKDGLMLRYRGTTGPPGSPEKTITFLE